MADLCAIWAAGRVLRWHTHPHLAGSGDRLDGHHARVARIILALHPEPSVALLRAALTHDDGEAVTGDRPRSLQCRRCSDDEDQEREAMWGRDVMDIPMEAAKWLHFADCLDAYLWAQHHAPQLMGQPEWIEHRDGVLCLAYELRVGGKVREALYG